MKTHKNLVLWGKSIDLVICIYEVIKKFPKEESFGLVSQIKRAAVSIPANISEGAARNSSKEFIRFLQISQGSLSELETLIIISLKLNYLDDKKFKELMGSFNEIRAMLSNLIKAIKLAE